jgi:hypothetical protein
VKDEISGQAGEIWLNLSTGIVPSRPIVTPSTRVTMISVHPFLFESQYTFIFPTRPQLRQRYDRLPQGGRKNPIAQ